MTPFSSFEYVRFACFLSPVATVARELTELLNGSKPPKAYRLNWSSETIDWDKFRTTIPGSQPLKIVLWSPVSRPETTVLVTNRSDGLAHTLRVFGRTYPQELIRVSIRDSATDLNPGCAFAHYADRMRVDREIAAIKDSDDWTFVQTGTPQAYEDPQLYKRRRIAERLTRGVIQAYLRKLGFDVSQDEFWLPKGSHATIEQDP